MADEIKILSNCGKTDCLNFAVIGLKITEDNKGYSLGVQPKNIKINHSDQTLGILITCLMCKYNESKDMYMQKSLIVNPNRKLI